MQPPVSPATDPATPPPTTAGGFIWFLAILAPFYGPINALYSSLAVPYLGFVLPCIALMWRMRKPKAREAALMKPWK